MQKRDEFGQVGIHIRHPRGHFFWMRRGVTDALNTGYLVHVFKQGREISDVLAITHFAAIRVDVLSKQSHFFDTLVCEVCNFSQHVFKRSRNFFATGIRHDTETAIFATAFHDGYESVGPFNPWGRHGIELFDFGETDIDLRATFAATARNQFWQAVQGLRTKNHVDIRCSVDDGAALLASNASANTNYQIRIRFF